MASEAVLSVPALNLSGELDLSGATPADNNYARNPDGSPKLKKDGSPALKRGRKAGSPFKKSSSPTGAVSSLLGVDEEARDLVNGLVEDVATPQELAQLLAATFAIPGALVDESFNLTDEHGEPNKRCQIAARRLFPLCKKYGTASLAKWMPEILAVWGVIELAKPAVGPTLEIIAGTRAPLIYRNDIALAETAAPSPPAS